ncbi:hypothetical protein LJR090_001805 [Bosea sp. LjRoot90]|uniref:hypothetical protein n=1 Tax=Bosea sp. LjRoot90 TaxID=3342342 RepID=UPI003ECE9576
MQMSYAREKLHNAVTTMAVSAERIQRRVCDAYVYNLIHIRPEGLPAEFVSALAEITSAMSTRRATADEGDAWATCSQMTDDEASEIARKIFDLWERADSDDPMRKWK